MYEKKITKAGFVLLELLLTIFITVLLSAMGLAYYSNFNRRQIVAQTALNLKNDLRKMQNKAAAGEKDPAVCGQNPMTALSLNGWFLLISPNSYLTRGQCGGLVFSSQTISLPSNLTLSSFPVATVVFLPLMKGNTQVTFCLTGFSKTYRLILTGSGEIKDDNFVTTCP